MSWRTLRKCTTVFSPGHEDGVDFGVYDVAISDGKFREQGQDVDYAAVIFVDPVLAEVVDGFGKGRLDVRGESWVVRSKVIDGRTASKVQDSSRALSTYSWDQRSYQLKTRVSEKISWG